MTANTRTGFCLTSQKLVVRRLVVACHIGVTERERATAQRLALSLELRVTAQRPVADRLENVVDYGAVARRVREVCRDTRVQLLESLADEIAGVCFDEPTVEQLCLRIEKLDRYQDLDGIGVEMEYTRSPGDS